MCLGNTGVHLRAGSGLSPCAAPLPVQLSTCSAEVCASTSRMPRRRSPLLWGLLGRSRGEPLPCLVAPGYRNTELADLHLASDGEYSLHGLAMHNNDHFWNLFADLELAVREGADAAFGRKTADPVQVP